MRRHFRVRERDNVARELIVRHRDDAVGVKLKAREGRVVTNSRRHGVDMGGMTRYANTAASAVSL